MFYAGNMSVHTMYIFMVFLFLTACAIEYPILKRNTENECGSSLTLSCIQVKPPILSCAIDQTITAEYNPGNCTFQKLTYDWYITKDNDKQIPFLAYAHKEIFTIKKLLLHPGPHKVRCVVKQSRKVGGKYVTETLENECVIVMKEEKPIPIISGGSERTVPAGKSILVQGQKSVDPNKLTGTSSTMIFEWTCEETGVKTNFCSQTFKKVNYLYIPSKSAIDEAVYVIQLSVKVSQDSPEETTTQTIRVVQGAVNLAIECVKNCLTIPTNIKEEIVLKASCLEHCPVIPSNAYTWTISDTSFDYEKHSKGNNKRMFTILEDVLKYGTNYTVTVKLDKLEGSASIFLAVPEPVKLEKCTLDPTSGTTFTTIFHVSCDYTPRDGDYMFKVYSVKDNTNFLIGMETTLGNLNIRLSANSQVKVVITDQKSSQSDSQIISADVKAALDKNANPVQLIESVEKSFMKNDSVNSIPNLLASESYDLVVMASTFLIDELIEASKKNPDNKDIEALYEADIIMKLSEIPIQSVKRAQQLAGLASKIASSYENKSDPDVSSMITNFCSHIAESFLDVIEKDEKPERLLEDAKDTTRLLSKCSEAGLAPNEEILIAPAAHVNLTSTAVPPVVEEMITEDYPEYVDDDYTAIAYSKFKEASDNLIQICYLNSKAIQVIVKNKFGTQYVTGDSFNISYTLNQGYDLASSEISFGDVVLKPPEDLKNIKHLFEILLCTTRKNPFWWTSKKVPTSVAILYFIDGKTKKLVQNFEKPFQLSFNVYDKTALEAKIYNGSLPEENYIGGISVHKITVKKGSSYFVEFHDVGEMIFDVVLVHFEMPQEKHFANKVIISNSSSLLFQDSISSDYHSLEYLAVLPKNKGASMTYKFSVYSLGCYQWSEADINWKFACKALETSNTKRIDCSCYHLSTVVGMFEDIAVDKIDQPLIIEVELKSSISFIIFLTVLVLFLFLCILLMMFSLKKTTTKNIMFLGDVARYSRYLYVVIVKTSNRNFAGTTSNVVLKIFGERSESLEHVLNYPDPEKRLLQRDGENWFVLGTEAYLGELKKIDLNVRWTGSRPSWHCSEIQIFDMQEEKNWSFPVNMWFDISTMDTSVYSFYTNGKPGRKIKTRLSALFHKILEQPHFWNITKSLEYFSYIQRLLVMYSATLSMLSLNLWFYGVPKMKKNDSLPYICYYEWNSDVFLNAFGAAVLSYILHFTLLWILRNYANWTRIIWTIILFNTIFNMSFLLIFGFWVPHLTSLLWLTSSIFSLILYIVVLENLSKIFNIFIYRTQIKIDSVFKKVKLMLEYIERQRAMLYENFGEYILRPYITQLYTPLNEEQINDKKAKYRTKKIIMEILEDIAMFLVYITLLYLVISFQKDSLSYLSSKQIRSLVTKIHTRSIKSELHDFEQIKTEREIIDYIRTSLLFSLQGNRWYKRYISSIPGMMWDFQNKYLGVMRLRQHRVQHISCTIPKAMLYLNLTCKPEYQHYPEYKNFGQSWSNDTEAMNFLRLGEAWTYNTRMFGDAVPFDGELANYPGGGYVAKMGRYLKNSLINFSYLVRNKWLDDQTRCVFAEFLAYNANCNLFNAVRVVFELSATGYVHKIVDIQTAKFLFVKLVIVQVIIFTCFLTILFLLTIRTVIRIIRDKRLFLKDLWTIIDVIIITMSVVCIFMFVEQTKLTKRLLNQLREAKHNDFVGYFQLFLVDDFLTILAAVLVCVATVRLWKLLRFMFIFRIVEKTIATSASTLLAAFVGQMLVLFAFAFIGMILFGDKTGDFRNFGRAFVTLIVLSLNLHKSFDFMIFETSDIAYAYYMIFMIITLLIYTLYVAIIMIHYTEAQFHFSNGEKYSVNEFLKEQYKYFSTLFLIRLKNIRVRGGANVVTSNKKKVIPKQDEHRYAECYSLPTSKLNAMANVSRCVLKNLDQTKKPKKDLSKTDADLMVKTVSGLYGKDWGNKEVFFVGRTVGSSEVKLVDDLRLKEMEILAENMLTLDREKDMQKVLKQKAYRKVMDGHKKKLEFLDEYLGSLVNVLENIDIQ